MGAALALFLLGSALITGVSQGPFDTVHSVETYTELLKNNTDGLRLWIALDNVFLVIYASFFTLLAAVLREDAERYVVNVGLAAMLLTALLDSYENLHILTMLTSVKNNLPILLSDIQTQMTVSQVKFHSGYLSLFLFGFAFPRQTVLERVIVWLFWYVQLPIGILTYAVSPPLLMILRLGQMLLFIISFLIMAKIFWDRAQSA